MALFFVAGASLGLAALLLGRGWPGPNRARVAAGAVAAGVAYVIFSARWDVSVRGFWTYASATPPRTGIGLAPLARRLVVPPLGFAIGARIAAVLQRAGRRQ